MLAKLHALNLGANERSETSRPAHMRPSPELHETEIETETDYYETETKAETKKVVSRPEYHP